MVRIPFHLQDARFRFIRLKMHSKEGFPGEDRRNHLFPIQLNISMLQFKLIKNYFQSRGDNE